MTEQTSTSGPRRHTVISAPDKNKLSSCGADDLVTFTVEGGEKIEVQLLGSEPVDLSGRGRKFWGYAPGTRFVVVPEGRTSRSVIPLVVGYVEYLDTTIIGEAWLDEGVIPPRGYPSWPS